MQMSKERLTKHYKSINKGRGEYKVEELQLILKTGIYKELPFLVTEILLSYLWDLSIKYREIMNENVLKGDIKIPREEEVTWQMVYWNDEEDTLDSLEQDYILKYPDDTYEEDVYLDFYTYCMKTSVDREIKRLTDSGEMNNESITEGLLENRKVLFINRLRTAVGSLTSYVSDESRYKYIEEMKDFYLSLGEKGEPDDYDKLNIVILEEVALITVETDTMVSRYREVR